MNWQEAKIGDLADQIRGVTYSKGDAITAPQPGYIPILRAGNITSRGLALKDLLYIPEAKVSNSQRIRLNDIIVATSSGSLDVVGKANTVRKDFNGSFGAFCKVLRPKENVHPGYLSHFLQTPHYRRHVRAAASGANINNLKNEHLNEVRLPLPSLTVQRQVALLLDRAEALCAKRRNGLAQLDELVQSTFLDLFGNAENANWKLARVEELALQEKGSIRTGPFGSQLLHEEFVNQGIAVLGIDNAVTNAFQWSGRRFITEKKYQELKRYTVNPGDVLITIMGTCGRCAIVPNDIPPAINTKHLCCITLDQQKCLPTFLHAYFLRHPSAQRYLRKKAKGAIMSGLNTGIIKELPVPLPPLELQQEFAHRVEAIERMKERQRAHLAELDALFASLQHRAFRGEL